MFSLPLIVQHNVIFLNIFVIQKQWFAKQWFAKQWFANILLQNLGYQNLATKLWLQNLSSKIWLQKYLFPLVFILRLQLQNLGLKILI